MPAHRQLQVTTVSLDFPSVPASVSGSAPLSFTLPLDYRNPNTVAVSSNFILLAVASGPVPSQVTVTSSDLTNPIIITSFPASFTTGPALPASRVRSFNLTVAYNAPASGTLNLTAQLVGTVVASGGFPVPTQQDTATVSVLGVGGAPVSITIVARHVVKRERGMV